MIKLSWNRDGEGVITIYGTWPNGQMAPVADVWRLPLVTAGMTSAKAHALQQQIAEKICESVILTDAAEAVPKVTK